MYNAEQLDERCKSIIGVRQTIRFWYVKRITRTGQKHKVGRINRFRRVILHSISFEKRRKTSKRAKKKKWNFITVRRLRFFFFPCRPSKRFWLTNDSTFLKRRKKKPGVVGMRKENFVVSSSTPIVTTTPGGGSKSNQAITYEHTRFYANHTACASVRRRRRDWSGIRLGGRCRCRRLNARLIEFWNSLVFQLKKTPPVFLRPSKFREPKRRRERHDIPSVPRRLRVARPFPVHFCTSRRRPR